MSRKIETGLIPWLRRNCGKHCTGALTDHDRPALFAATHCANVWLRGRTPGAAKAFALCVQEMQPSTRYLAYHAIAYMGDWGHRLELWQRANLSTADIKGRPDCAYGPRGQGAFY